MAVQEWPVASGSRAGGACVLVRPNAGGARVGAAAALVASVSALPFSDADRARVPVIVEGLVRGVEGDLRLLTLPELDEAREPELHASFGSAAVPLAAPRMLAEADLPPGLLQAALVRAEMHRLAGHAESRPPTLDGPAAAERMALLVAESRRVDAFGEPARLVDDLPAEAAHALVWTLAARLRAVLHAGGQPAVRADALATAAGRDRLSRYDEAAGLPAVAARLAQALAGAGALDDALLVRMTDGAELPALTAALAQRAGLPAAQIWPLLADPGEGRLALLLRAAGVGREPAARLLLRFLHASDDPAAELDRYDRCGAEEAQGALAVLGHDPVYRDALGRLAAAAS